MIKDKKADTVLESTEGLFEEFPSELCLSITYDNGTEFARHQEIENWQVPLKLDSSCIKV